MAELQNNQVTDKFQELTKISNVAELPRQINNSISPVLVINPQYESLSGDLTSANSGAFTILTTPSDKDFYLTYVTLNFECDAACDCGAMFIECIDENGFIFRPLYERKLSLVAQQRSATLSLSTPIKLKRNTNVVIEGVFTVGNCVRSGTAGGFVVDNLKK